MQKSLDLKHFKNSKVEYVMFSLVKQIRPFTTSLNLSVHRNTPAGHQGFDITRTVIPQLNNPAGGSRMMLQNPGNEDVSYNRAWGFKPAGKQLTSLQSMYVFVVALKERLEKLSDLVSPLRVQVEHGLGNWPLC